MRTYNISFALGVVSRYADSFKVKGTSAYQIKFGKSPVIRVAKNCSWIA